ncbi:MAG: 4-oxalocrotonate tautomerase [Planctomycetota bacterium]|jgi:4-oxalocrotonate tautomerase
MPIIDITMVEGRGDEVKRVLMREITELVVKRLEVPSTSVRVVVREVPAKHWCVGGVTKDQM